MNRCNASALAALAAAVLVTSETRAQEAPASDPDGAPATGFLLQARMPTLQPLLGGATGAPGFLVGLRTADLSIGAGLGYLSLAVDTPEGDTDVRIFQVAPAVLWDLWKSADGLSRFNLVGGLGFGRATVDVGAVGSEEAFGEESAAEPGFGDSGFDKAWAIGQRRRGQSRDADDGEASLSLLTVLLGVGGDHYLHRNFALGVEAGVQMLFVTDIQVEGEDVEVDISTNSFYGLLRATFVVGS